MTSIFFGGSRKISRLSQAVKARLDVLIAKDHVVLVGDANGVDKAVQTYLAGVIYKNVRVYCMDFECRNNLGAWEVVSVDSKGRKKDFSYFALKDARMSQDANYGFMIWDGVSKGTLNNTLNLVQQGKPVVVYFAPSSDFVSVRSRDDVLELVNRCSAEARNDLNKTIDLDSRSSTHQGNLFEGQ